MLGRWLSQFFGKNKSSRIPKQRLHLLDCQIHGSHYYECLNLVQADNLHQGERLTLIREPDNEYDKYAIEVYTTYQIKLGYVPKNYNRVIAELMDQGCQIYAIIERIEPEHWEPVTIDVELAL